MSSDSIHGQAIYRSLFENSYSIMLIINPDTGVILDANKAARKFYQYSKKELLGMPVSNINTLSQEEIDAEIADARQQKRSHFIFSHRLKTGETRDVEVHSGPIEFKNQKVLYSIIHDITEKKQTLDDLQKSESTIRAMINATKSLVYLFDRKGIIINLNKTGALLFHKTPGEMMGKNFNLFFGENDFSRLRMMVAEVFKTGSPINYQREREEKYLDINLYPVFDDTDRVSMICTFATDITDLIKTQQVFAAIETAGGICHEMNQPLQVILGSLELLKLSLGKDDPNYSLVNRISSQTERLGTITKKLTHITRYETKKYLKGTIFDIEKSSERK